MTDHTKALLAALKRNHNALISIWTHHPHLVDLNPQGEDCEDCQLIGQAEASLAEPVTPYGFLFRLRETGTVVFVEHRNLVSFERNPEWIKIGPVALLDTPETEASGGTER